MHSYNNMTCFVSFFLFFFFFFSSNDSSKAVAVRFMKYFDFKNDSLVDSLRFVRSKSTLFFFLAIVILMHVINCQEARVSLTRYT